MFLGLDDPGVSTTIGPAAVAAVAGIVIALISRRTTRRTAGEASKASGKAEEAAAEARLAREELSTRIGTPNGKGNVVQMNEKQLRILELSQERDLLIDRRFLAIEERLSQTGGLLTKLDGKFDTLTALITSPKETPQ